MKLKTKPLSAKVCWRGRRFRTDEYDNYADYIRLMLPDLQIPEETPLFIFFQWGVSEYMGTNLDEPTEPFLEILSNRYGFKRAQVCSVFVDKIGVERGEEYIRFFICSSDDHRLMDLQTQMLNRAGQLMNSAQEN